jgi:cysteine desulfurase/selenocysteine lyase
VEAIGFGAAVDYVQSIGLEAIHAHEAALVRHLRRELAAMNDVRLFGPEDPPASSALRWKVHPHDLGTILDEGAPATAAWRSARGTIAPSR